MDLNLIKYEERDIYLNQEYKNQLRLRCKAIMVPALFVDGKYIGVGIVKDIDNYLSPNSATNETIITLQGFKELESMNENKELNRLLAKFKVSSNR